MKASTMQLRHELRDIAEMASRAADGINDTQTVRTMVNGVPNIIHDLTTRLTRATMDWAKTVGAEATTQE